MLWNHHYEYLGVLIICAFLPLLIGYYHPRSPIRKQWKAAWIAITVSSIPFLIWDIFATYRGHWNFNPRYNLGLYVFNLPIEEVLFFFVIPYCCLFSWTVLKFALNHFRPFQPTNHK